MGKVGNAYRISVSKPEWKTHLRDLIIDRSLISKWILHVQNVNSVKTVMNIGIILNP